MLERRAAVALIFSLTAPTFAELSPALQSAADASLAGASSRELSAAKESAASAFGAGVDAVKAPPDSVDASVPAAGGGAAVPNLTGPTLGAPEARVPQPSPEKEWNPKQKGWGGFKNGFGKGFAWTETPAMKVYEAGFAKGSYFWIPTPFYFFTTAAAIVTGIVLLPVALVVGAGRGVYGAIAGEKEF